MRGIKLLEYIQLFKNYYISIFFFPERKREGEGGERKERKNKVGRKQRSRGRGKEGEGKEKEGRKEGTKERWEGQKKEGSLNSSRWLLSPLSYSSPSSPNPFLLFPLYFTSNHRQALGFHISPHIMALHQNISAEVKLTKHCKNGMALPSSQKLTWSSLIGSHLL